jgi:hypothetical protein
MTKILLVILCLPDSGFGFLIRLPEKLLGITSLFQPQVLIFLLNITPEDQRKNDKITAVLAKEIQLKHRAPVIDIVVFDSGGLPVAGNEFCGFQSLFQGLGSGFNCFLSRKFEKSPPPQKKRRRRYLLWLEKLSFLSVESGCFSELGRGVTFLP